MNLNEFTTKELEDELERRKNNPTWFFRELASEGLLPDSDDPGYEDFQDATAWMDDPGDQRQD